MTAYIEVLTEGASDLPVVQELLQRHFQLPNAQFRIHPHQGRGRLPNNFLAIPSPQHRGLLDQLPAKLRGFAWLPPTALVLVLIDADNDNPANLLAALDAMLTQLPKRPARVLFCLAVEETESWFLADPSAMKQAFPHARLRGITDIPPDAIVGAWEKLALALNENPSTITGARKCAWAKTIAPHLDFTGTQSPSLQALVQGIQTYLSDL